MAEDSGYDFGVLRGVIAANQAQQDGVVDKIERMVDGSLSGAVVAAWGLAFKAGTDDIRDSPAVAVINRLLDAGAAVQMFDPVVRWLDGVRTRPDPYSACAGADVLAVLTEWPLFSQLDLCRVKDLMTSPRIVDARNVLNASYASTLGFAYEGVGRRGWSELSELYTVDATGSSEQVSSA
jgi:UDPglucose 6-dehydrogenase